APNPAPGPQDKRVNLNVHDMRLRAAVDMLFQGTGLNVAVEPAVPDVPITLSVMDQPFKTALRMLIRVAADHIPGLTCTQDRGLYLIKIREARAPEAAPAPLEAVREEESHWEKIPLNFVDVARVTALLGGTLVTDLGSPPAAPRAAPAAHEPAPEA